MSKIVKINGEFFKVQDYEYKQFFIEEFYNLNILKDLGHHERIVSLLNELTKIFDKKINGLFLNSTHGGYIPIKCSEHFENLFLYNENENNNDDILENIKSFNIQNINFVKEINLTNYDIVFIPDSVNLTPEIQNIKNSVIVCSSIFKNYINSNYEIYDLSKVEMIYPQEYSELIVCIPRQNYINFVDKFKYFVYGKTLDYDNLINYCMIIKNGGETLEKVLNENLHIIDSWTILDTGSTDGTIETIKKVLVGKKKGNLYEEPFINFRESRNRCLDLGSKRCKFSIMLDDTYVVKGNFKKFLNTVRGDQFSDSFSLYINSYDCQYISNRIIKNHTGLRYIYKIHEVITPENNISVITPIEYSSILDYSNEYMQDRTNSRKEYDLKMLFETIEEYPNDSRTYYYIAQTYSFLEKHELALKYFLERVNHPDEGFNQEKIDAYFEAARLCNFKLNKPWEQCLELYMKAYEMDKTRPDSIYFIGVHYYLEAKDNIEPEKNFKLAYDYFKLGFELGYPLHSQYSLKPTLSFYFLPKFLQELCYYVKDYIVGEKACKLFLDTNKPNSLGVQPFKEIYDQNDYDNINSMYTIYKILNTIPLNDLINKIPENNKKPYLCFHTDGGFSTWTGKDILSKGIGGSETYIIELARYIQKSGYFNVVVFCNCEENDVFENVEYKKLSEFNDFIIKETIHTCIVSRYSEFLPLCLNAGNIKNVYLSLHDLLRPGEIIIRQNKLKGVLCLSDYHTEVVSNSYPILKDINRTFNYGIDFKLFLPKKDNVKIPYKFIYSSFPNRGLLPLLMMWPKIVERYPQASLHIHCDIDNNWAVANCGEEMKLIKKTLFEDYNKLSNINIFYYGWTDKKTLADNWLSSDIWFYPCTFLETFCLTALEAALTKTFVVTRNFGALKNIGSERAILIDSENLRDPYNIKWQENALKILFEVIENKELKERLINKNYEFAKKMSWKSRADDLLKNYIYDLPTPSTIEKLNSKYIDYIKWKSNSSKIKILEISGNDNMIGADFFSLIPNCYLTIIDKNHDSIKSLTELNKQKETYDFIYINESDKPENNYSNLVLGFSILRDDGMLYFNTKNILEEVNNFLRVFKDKIKIISITETYELFLEKI